MGIVDLFKSFAADLEITVRDDNWLRLEKYLAEDATYVNVGGPDPKCKGRASVTTYLKEDVSNTDRRFDTRTLIALTPPKVDGNSLSRRWRCTFTLAETPDLVIEGEARYLFEGDLIKENRRVDEEVWKSSGRLMNSDHPASDSLCNSMFFFFGGGKIMNEHEKINYIEFPAKDIKATKAFFSSVFSWSFVDYGPDYVAFEDEGINGGFFKSDLCSSTANGATLVVFYSNELESTEKKIEGAGGSIIRHIFPFPGGRRFHFSDPNGNEYAVWSDTTT